jgi:predicted RNase H-related nuclease YkuK (DUF458 family)
MMKIMKMVAKPRDSKHAKVASTEKARKDQTCIKYIVYSTVLRCSGCGTICIHHIKKKVAVAVRQRILLETTLSPG